VKREEQRKKRKRTEKRKMWFFVSSDDFIEKNKNFRFSEKFPFFPLLYLT